MKVSIIIPVYNTEKFLIECLESLVNQTLASKEIIIVDDGSTDNSYKILKEYSERYKFVKVFKKENGGQSSARNLGLSKASGEYIMFVDSDDFIELDTLESMTLIADKYRSDIVRGKYIYCNENGESEKYDKPEDLHYYNHPLKGKRYLVEAIRSNRYDIAPVVNCIRKSYLDQINLQFIEGFFYEDQEYTLKLLTLGDPIVVQTNKYFYHYRINSQSTTKTHSLKKAKDILNVIGEMIVYIDKSDFPKEIEKYAYMTVSYAFSHMAIISLGLEKRNQKLFNKMISKHLKKLIIKYPTYRTNTNIQNYLFLINPKLLAYILRIYKRFRCQNRPF